MKKNASISGVVISLLLISATGSELFSQTSGTLSFTITTTAPPTSNYGTDNLLAIWIQSSTTSLPADFIKTKIKYAGTSTANDHLPVWVAVSGRNVVDAVSGASLTSYGTFTFLWNGTNVAGTVVTDGQYYVRAEMAWDDTQSTLSSYVFTKGNTLFQSNPANTANFLNVGLTWTPLSTGIEGTLETKDFNVYPNPSKGMLNIDFKIPVEECLLQVVSKAGMTVFNERIPNFTTGVRTFDLSDLPSGIYYCSLYFPSRTVAFSLIITK